MLINKNFICFVFESLNASSKICFNKVCGREPIIGIVLQNGYPTYLFGILEESLSGGSFCVSLQVEGWLWIISSRHITSIQHLKTFIWHRWHRKTSCRCWNNIVCLLGQWRSQWPLQHSQSVRQLSLVHLVFIEYFLVVASPDSIFVYLFCKGVQYNFVIKSNYLVLATKL